MEYLYLILERKILLLYYCGMHRCLIIFIFWKFRDCFYLLASLAKAISGRAEIVECSLDTDMMMCKKSSDAHLFSHDIIDFHGKQCTVFSPICTMLFGICAIVPFICLCRRLNANFTEDGPRGYVWHNWWMILRGRMCNVTEWVKRSILSIVENYATAIYLFVSFIGIHI